MITAPARLAATVVTLALGGAVLAGCASSPATTTSSQAAAKSTTTTTSATTTAASTSSAPASTASQPAGYTLADVQQHKDATSCWSAIDGNVYDLTAWINAHPGGAQRIKNICGTDGTNEFKGAHSGDNTPQARLATFKLGPLS